jgi:S1-C subfamily serine protease
MVRVSRKWTYVLAFMLLQISCAHAPEISRSKEQIWFNKAAQDVYFVEHRPEPGVKGDHTWAGSGFQVLLGNGRKVIITNDHVCLGEVSQYAYVRNYVHREPMTARIIAYSVELDLCALETVGFDGYYNIAPLSSVYQWEKIRYYGYPAGLGLSMFEANLLGSKIDIDKDGHTSYTPVFNNVAIPGNSGGPMVDAQDHVLGVVTWHMEEQDDLGGYVDLLKLTTFLRAVSNL